MNGGQMKKLKGRFKYLEAIVIGALATELLLLNSLSAAASFSLASGSSVARKPNIIVIMVDDLGYSDLGCYGGEIQTPHIDQLAKEGVRFTGFKNTARCTPSRASLLTGRYAHAVGVGCMTHDHNLPGYRGQLSADAPTMAEILKPHGYASGVVGKWHQTFTGRSSQKPLYPLDRGFDFFYGTWWGAKDYFSPKYMMKNHEHIDDNTEYPTDFYLTHALTDSAIEFVQNQIDQDRPFYLYLAHYAPHAPIQAPKDRVQKCYDRYLAGFEILQRERFARQLELGVVPKYAKIAATMSAWDKLNEFNKSQWVETMATYAAMIEIMDDGIGELIETLKKGGHYDNTLILVFSDNGATPERKGKPPVSSLLAALSNTPFRSYKAHTFEGGIASPLIINWPDQFREYAGTLRHGPCHIIDILPTCLNAAGIEFPSTFNGNETEPPDGASLIQALAGAGFPKRPLFWEHCGRKAIYQDGWKLVAPSANSSWKLYNLKRDPTEQNDLSKQYTNRAAMLQSGWSQWANQNNVFR